MTISLDFLAIIIAVVVGNLLAGVVRWLWGLALALAQFLADFAADTSRWRDERRAARLQDQLARCEQRRAARACAKG